MNSANPKMLVTFQDKHAFQAVDVAWVVQATVAQARRFPFITKNWELQINYSDGAQAEFQMRDREQAEAALFKITNRQTI